ncbi:MAG: IS1595 family transposase [Candidatus Binataceae bacterium]|jgi:transposase-like protein
MNHARFETLKREIAATATVDQPVDLEAQTAPLLAVRVSETLILRRSTDLSRERKCPHCGGDRIVRHGRDRAGRQRFRCIKIDEAHGCGRTFNALCGTAFARMRKPGLWTRYATHLARGTSLTRIVAGDDTPISRLTAWRWRHRLLAALGPSKPERLGGIVEVGETFFLRSFKGHRGWKRGTPSGEPPTALSRLRRAAAGSFAPAGSDPDRHRSQWPPPQCHDGTALQGSGRRRSRRGHRAGFRSLHRRLLGIRKISRDGRRRDHRVFSLPKDDWLKKAMGHSPRRSGALGLGRVNAHHEKMKTLVNRRLRGVPTRYLPNYLVMLQLEGQPRASPRDLLLQAIATSG